MVNAIYQGFRIGIVIRLSEKQDNKITVAMLEVHRHLQNLYRTLQKKLSMVSGEITLRNEALKLQYLIVRKE